MLSLIYSHMAEKVIGEVFKIIMSAAIAGVVTKPAIEEVTDLLQAPIAYAVRHRYISLLKCAFFLGCDPNKRDRHGQAPLSYALEPYSETLATLLLSYGANINNFSKKEATLQHAVANNHKNIARFLIKNQASFCFHDDFNFSYNVLDIAIYKKNLSMVELLIDHMLVPPPLMAFYYFNNAVRYGTVSIARALIEKWPSINVNGLGPVTNKTPLMTAACAGNAQMITFLYHHGALLNMANVDGQTALYFTSDKNRQSLLHESFEAEIESRNRYVFY